MIKYTWYIVSRGRNDHYPVLVANNGKIPFNESVTRAAKLKRSLERFADAYDNCEVAVVHITHAEFRKKFPRFARNAGGRKKR